MTANEEAEADMHRGRWKGEKKNLWCGNGQGMEYDISLIAKIFCTILKIEYQSPRGNIMPFRNNKGVHRQSFVRSIHIALGISAQAVRQDLRA